MKKLTLGLLSVLLLALGACNSDVDDTTQTVAYSTMNLVTPLDGGESFVSKGTYKFFLNMSKGKGCVSTANLMIDNKAHSFQTDTVAYGYAGGNGILIRLQNLKGYLDNDKTMPLTNDKFDITSYYYVPPLSIPGYSQMPDPYPYVIAQYTAGNWQVATFQEDCSYIGKTTTSYIGQDGSTQAFENDKMLYRVLINTDKKTADIIIYNAKFASSDKAPTIAAILLKDLKVTWGKGSYAIEGENVVPSVIEGAGWQENPKFVFDSFKFFTLNKELTQADMSYKVAGMYDGQFVGSYVVPESKN